MNKIKKLNNHNPIQRKEMRKMEKEILEEQKRTNELLEKLIKQNKDPYELLTINQIHEEFGIGTNMLNKMFRDPELPVQKYTVPFKVQRRAFEEYTSVRRDYLCSN